MNNRINELKKIALEKFAANHSLTVRQISPVLDQKSQQEVDMIFAKLIVMECAQFYPDTDREGIGIARRELMNRFWGAE